MGHDRFRSRGYHLERIDHSVLLVQLLIGLSQNSLSACVAQPLPCHRQSIAFPPIRRLNGVTMLRRVCRNEK